MNTPFKSPADASTAASRAQAAISGGADVHAGLARIRVWDAPTRVFHWLMALSFAGAYLTAESERLRLVHVSLGYTLAGLIIFRVFWGFVGTRHARFASFTRGPAAVAQYLRSLASGRPEHHTGHNPAGALAVLALLGLGAVLTFTGWANYNELLGEAMEDVHETTGNIMLALVAVHVAAVVVSSWLHRENLARAMVTGFKLGHRNEAIGRAWRPLAALMVVVAVGFWAWQWQTAPAPGDTGTAATAGAGERRHGRDDDDD